MLGRRSGPRDGGILMGVSVFFLLAGMISVGPTSCDTQPGVEVVHNGEDGGGTLQRMEISRDEAHQRDDDDEEDAQPADMLVPVPPCHGRLCDVRLFRAGGRLGMLSAACPSHRMCGHHCVGVCRVFVTS